MAAQQQQNASDSTHSQTIYNPPAGHTQLYINNIPWTTTTDELSQWFQTKVGVTPTQVNIAVSTFKKSAGRSRGFGFATVPDSYKQKALDLSGAELNGRELSIVEARNRDESQAIKTERREQRAATREQQPQNGKLAEQPTKKKEHAPAVRPARKTFDNATQLYINNLGWDVTVETLTKFFEKHIGTTPVEVEIVSNKFGRFKGSSKGFGFVVVPNEALDKALALNDSEELGRKIYVQVSRPPTERPEGEQRAPSTRSRGPRKPRAENGGEQNGNDSRRRREVAEDDA